MHPSRNTPDFAALLVNRIVTIAVPAPPQGFPISNHCHVSPISPLGIAQATSFAIGKKKPLATFGATFLERQKNPKFWANFENMLLLDTIKQNLVSFAFFGLRVAEFWRQLCGGRCHTFFCLDVLASNNSKDADFGRNLALLKVLSTHPRSCRPFPP